MAGRDLLAGIPRDELLSASERLRAKAPQGRDLLEGASEGDLRAAETRLRERAARDEEAKANRESAAEAARRPSDPGVGSLLGLGSARRPAPAAGPSSFFASERPVAAEREQFLAENRTRVPTGEIKADNYIEQQAAKIGQAGLGLAAGGARAVIALSDKLQRNIGVLPGDQAARDVLTTFAEDSEITAGRRVEGTTSFEDVKENPLLAGKFILDEGPASLAITPLLLNPYGAAAVGLGTAGGIAQERAVNDGRTEATAGDLAVAAPFAAGSLALDKFGFDRLLNPGSGALITRILKAGGTEGLTEGTQGALENLGGSLGTERGVDLNELRDSITASALVGTGAGAGFRGGSEAVDATAKAITARRAARATITPDDEASPLDTADIEAGRAAQIEVELGKQQSSNIELPEVGGRVNVLVPGSSTPVEGTFAGSFSDADGAGIEVILSDGQTIREYNDNIEDAGYKITPIQSAASGSAAAGPAAPTASPSVRTGQQSGAAGFDMGRYQAQNSQIESGNRPYIKADTSSASGLFQFVKKTWIAEGGAWGNDDSQAFGGLKPSAEEQRARFKSFTDKNVAGIKAIGAPVTDGNVYLAHFLGMGGARSILGADPNTPVAQLLKDDQITANKSILKGKTAGDVIAWAARKMGGALPAQAGGESFAAPDTEREPFEFSNRDEPEAAAPALIGKPIPLRVEDRQETAVVPATLQEVPVRYAVAELADLVPSNTPDGAVNPAFPAERQPRDRTRAASQNQVRNIATNLYPRLLGRDVKASDGAPIISADGVVDSGNGRVMALSQAYAQGGQQVDAYRAMLEEEGFDVSGMTQPVMVRVRDEMPAADVARFVRDSNARSTASMSGVETASTDAASMGSNLLGLYRGGDLDTLNNSDFVRGFMQAFVPASEVGDMVMKDGRPSANLLRRIEAALLVRALGPQSFVEWLVDSRSSKIKSIGNALIETSGKLAQMREAAAQGIIDPSVDISANVAEAVTLVDRARREDRGVAEFVNQVDAFSGTLDPITEAVLRLMYKDPAFKKARSQKDLTNALTFYIEQAMVTVPGGGLIASTSNPASDILALANARQDDPTARPSAKPAAADGQIGSLVDPVEDVRPAGTDSGERAGEGVQPGAGTEGSGESQADLTDNRSDAVQREGEAESVDPTAGDDASPSYRLEDTTSGKGIALFDATPAQLAAIEAAGIAKPAKRSDGAMVFSKKREAAIRAALELVAEADGPILDRAERLRMVREAVNGSADTSIEGDLIVGPGLRLNFQTASESELRSALARVTETVTPAEDDTAKARGAAAPTTAGKGLLGRNRDGNEVFEDERGVRSYVENGIRLTESVQMRPVRGEGIRLSVDVANRWESYKTTEELGQEQAQEETRIGREYDSMLSDIRRAQQQLDSFGGEQDATFKSGGVKSRERVIVKATNEDGYNSVRDIKDLARGAFIVDSMEQAEALATAIGERFTVVQDKGWQRLDSGYADHKLIVESSGIKAELQIVPSVVWNAKKAGGANKLYEEQRAPGVSEERYAELERQQQEIYSAALEATGFAQFASAAKSASGNSASASSRESETPSLVASPGASAQVESSRQTNASGGAIENTAASRNSTSLNVGDTSTSEDNVGANSQESNNAEVNRFANNTLFTADKVEAARARMKDRMKRLNAGVDPEMLIDGMVIAGAYIEDGVRNFADFAKQMRADFGNGITPYLLSFWEGARNYPGLNTEGMTSPDVSRAISEMIAADAAPTVEQSSTVQPEPQADLPELARVFVEALRTRSFASITEARAFAKEATGQDFRPGTLEAKKLDEAIEAALVFNARAIVAEGAAPLATYRQLVSLYGRQPNLGVRTSTSVQEQAYSTPAPLAYLAALRAGISNSTTVYEPSAGNGMLLITADPAKVTANELNADRVAQLRDLYPQATITQGDATAANPDGPQRDRIIANPPFGPVKDEQGDTVIFDLGDGYEAREIDHAISLLSLDMMKNGGKAALIVGSVAKQTRNREDAYNGKAKREFYFRLYSEYNVTEHFTVNGDLYKKQGAAWPVDVIVIEGRGKSALPLPAVKAPRIYDSWDALENALVEPAQVSGEAGSADAGTAGAGQRPAGGNGDAGRGGNRGRADTGDVTAEQPGDVRGEPAVGQPDGVGLDQREAGRGSVDPAPRPVREPGRDRQRNAPQPQLAEGEAAPAQVRYSPASGSYSLDTLVPYNMQTAAQNALARIEAKHGSIDAYVADKLGFTREEMGKRLSAEATDAIGLALDNMDRVDPATGKGAAFIIGDQTGIGKGRVVASVLRYAMKEGRTAIFVTEKPNLYADIYRDMMDVGVKEMLGREPVLVMTNAGESIPLGGGKELKSGGSAAHSKRLERVARGEEQFDLLMTTYSQMQTVKGQVTQRQQVLEKLAEGAIIVFDESHNAGGQGPNERRDKKAEKGEVAPNRAEFARMLARKAQGVMFSSATYAKRPEVMDLYARTDMGLAVADPKDLGEAIANGGVPLQQVLASALADAGQYVRRERTWEGVNYRTPRVPVDEAVYGDVTEILRSIREFEDAFITEVKEAIDKDARAEAKSLSADGSVGGAGVSSTNFTSVMHNIIEQMLLSLKAGPAADRALEALRAGRKPVITVANTMGSFIQEYADERNIKTGGAIDLDFGAVFERYLDRTRQYTVRKPFSKEKGEKKYISDSELGPEGLAAFRAIQAKIRETAFGPLPISPIDFIAQRLKDEGYTVGEITGRSHTIDYAGGAPTLRLRGAKETGIAGRLAAVNGFNSGKINAMILNQSGSTGLSIHASDQFKDQSPRTMIIAQAERNVDTHMQMLGRIHRTGQVVLPEYDQLVAEVPAEMRPAAVLAKKMASLNANTTGARGSAVTSDEIPDFMNDFGDEVIARIMEEDTDLYRVLGKPLGESKNGGYIREGAARKVTGRLMLLPLAEQQDFYDNFLGQYQSYLAQKEAAGEAGLEAKTLPLDARIVDASNVVAATRAGTPFGEAVVMETLDVKRLGKPMSSAQVLERISETIGASVPDGSPASALDQLRRDGEGWISDTVSQPALTEFETYRQQTVDNASEKAAPEIADRLNQNRLAFRQLLDIAYPGRGVLLYNENGDPLGGVVINVDKRGKAKNPIALSTWHVTIATADSSRQITIPLSQLRTRNMPEDAGRLIEATSRIEGYPVLEAFDSMQAEAREKRVIFTGNILAAYKETNGKGQVVNFVGEDGSVRPGIMMRRGYNHSGVVKNRPVDFRMPKQVIEWMRGGREAYGAGVSVALDGGQIKVTTAASKRGGGDVFLNRDVIAALGTDFVKTSGGMVARAPESKATAVVAALMRTGAKLQAKTDLADARQLVAGSQDALDSRPDLFDAPAQPERTMTQAQRAELEARQQQGKARRGGQQGLGDQEGGLFSSERDQGSLFLRTESGEPITGQQASELEADLRARLDAMGLQRVNLRVGTRAQLARPGATRGPDGQYLPSLKLIAVASDAVNGSTFTLGHEAVHALRDLGAISQSDWSLLEGAAWTRNPEAQASIKRRYPDLRENAQREEAVADLFGRFQVNSEGTVGAIARIIRRTLGIFEAIRNALRGKGFTMDRRAFDVLEDIRTGRTAQDIGRFETGNAINKRSNPNTPTGGPDQFAESEGSLDSRAAVVSLAGSDPTWKGKTAVAFDKFRTTMQDRYMPMLRTQRTIETMTGESLPNSMNPYLGEELMTGRIGSRLEKLHEDMIGPLFDDMARAKVNVDELETFLYARHAPERNAKMQEINPDLAPGEGSGMTDIEAMAVMNRVRKAGKMEDMERLAAKVDALRDSALDFRVESGLMSQKAADEWRSTYEYYVPLRGFKEIEGELSEETAERINKSGGGINVRGPESKRAFGRRSKADSPLSYLILQAEEAIVRGETNRVAQRFIELARANPDEDFWQVNKVSVNRRMNPESGQVEEVVSYNLAAKDKDYTVVAKIDGKEVRVTMNQANPAARRLANSMRNITQHQLDWVTKYLGTVNRYLSTVNTTLNPEFIITNAFRDMQTAAINLQSIDVPGIGKAAAGHYKGALAASLKGSWGKGSGEWKQYYDEFMLAGGRVYFNNVENVEQIRARVKSSFDMANLKAGNGGEARLHVKRGFIAVRDAIENTNQGVENAVRLAAYRAAREAGVDQDKAASIAKNLTVNFNRRGTFGPALNAAYLFYNASVQGSVTLFLAAKHRKVQKVLAGIAVAGALNEFLNMMLSDDDDDGESFYDKIPSYEKSRNMIVMTSGSTYIKIPLAYGYGAIWEAGRTASEIYRRGGDKWQESAGNLVTTIVDSFNPVGGTDNIINFFAPTILDPLVDIELNKDFSGKPILPNQSPYDVEEPDAQRYFGSVGTHWREVTDFLTNATGGNVVEPGWVDVSPETLEYMFGFVTGAAGGFVDRNAALPDKVIRGEVEANDVPFVRKLIGGEPGWQDTSRYYDRVGEVEQAYEYTKRYIEAEQIPEARAYAERKEKVLTLVPAMKEAQKLMREVRKEKRTIDFEYEMGRLDDTQYEARRERAKEVEGRIVSAFNTRWNATLYPKEE